MKGDQPQIGVLVGVDVGKEQHRAQALTADGETLFEGSVGNDPAAVEELLDQVVAAAGEEHTPLVVVDMISGGAVLLLAAAERRGIPVAYVTGLRMRRAAQLYDGTAKTDPKDAWVLADYARRNLDRLHVVEATDRQLARMRALNGHDEDLAADQTRIINRLREALLSTCPGLERVIGNRLTSPGILDVLRKYPTIGQLRRAGRARIRNLIHKRSPRLSDKAAPLIWEAVKSQPIELPATEAWAQIIPNLADALDRTVSNRKQVEKTLSEDLRTHPLGQVLVTIPGFATRTTTRTLTEIGNPHRFANGAKLASYAGLAPTHRSSGTTLNATTHNRAGNKRLKNAMHQAAFVAIRNDPHAERYYQTKRDQGKSHRTALTAVARRRCNIILTMLKTQTPYNPHHQPNPT